MEIEDIALDNKYTKWYLSIIDNAKHRASTRDKAKTLLRQVEAHHVLPKAIHKNNDVVFLSTREHFIVHRLLVKMLTGHYKHQMQLALTIFIGNRDLNSKQIAICMENKHIPCSKSRRNNIIKSRSKSSKILCPHCNKEFDAGNYKRFHGENCKHNPNINPNVLIERSNTAKRSMNTQKKTNSFSKPTPKYGNFKCPHCGKEGTNYGAMQRHHFARCKFAPKI